MDYHSDKENDSSQETTMSMVGFNDSDDEQENNHTRRGDAAYDEDRLEPDKDEYENVQSNSGGNSFVHNNVDLSRMTKDEMIILFKQQELMRSGSGKMKNQMKNNILFKDEKEREELTHLLGGVIASLSYIFFYPSKQVIQESSTYAEPVWLIFVFWMFGYR